VPFKVGSANILFFFKNSSFDPVMLFPHNPLNPINRGSKQKTPAYWPGLVICYKITTITQLPREGDAMPPNVI
jgi:hypothetical protein